jgi:8-hydroxy-5-deazaflavin:NADPH oxidoreductase
MKIAIIGAGQVGGALAVRLAKLGHDVRLAGSSEGSESVKKTLAREPSLRAEPLVQAVGGAEIVFLATPYAANDGVLAELGSALEGKVLVDCTNPVGPGLSHGLKSETSGSARLQEGAPGAKVVKAFTIYGFENFENSDYPGYGVKPAMMFCGDDAEAKSKVGELIAGLGFEPVDVGGLEQALHLEHMTLLWVRMVRAKGHSPNLVWAALRR